MRQSNDDPLGVQLQKKGMLAARAEQKNIILDCCLARVNELFARTLTRLEKRPARRTA